VTLCGGCARLGADCERAVSVTDISIEGFILANLFMLSLGIFSVAWWPELPDLGVSAAIVIALLPLLSVSRLRILVFLAAGMFWGIFSGHQLLDNSLPEALGGEEFLVSGRIISLVDSNTVRSRFSFASETIQTLDSPQQQLASGKLLLSWYAGQQLEAGQRWQLVVRLRRPRGFVNPGVFDYQSWLLQQGYMASGYVRSPELAEQLPEQFGIDQLLVQPLRLRSVIRNYLEEADLSPRGRAVLLALSIGDKSQLASWWQDLARLGIVHLLVISGLHIGLMALLGGLVGKGFTRLSIALFALYYSVFRFFGWRRLGFSFGFGKGSLKGLGAGPNLDPTVGPSFHWLPPLMGLLAAGAYSLLAGFSLPTQRALIGVAVVVLAKLCWRPIQPFVCLVWAITLIALLQPLAVLSAGFWLSFTAVATLILWFSPWRSTDLWWGKKRTLSAQLALLAIMSVPLLLFIGRLSWLAPLVNIVAVPWVSLVTVPSALLGCLLLIVSESAAEAVWRLADGSIELLWQLLDLLPQDLGFLVSPVGASSLVLTAALLGGICLMLPTNLSERWLGLLPMLLLLVFAERPKFGLRVTVLDVGQGLAVVVETQRHSLVYDSALQYSPAFSAGSGIIAPYLWRRGWSAIDMTLISHEDRDHSGGFAGLQQVLPSRQIMTGPGVAYTGTILDGATPVICRRGTQWRWDGALFEILAPVEAQGQSASTSADKSANKSANLTDSNLTGNDSSCVLRIRWRDITLLLPGDIESTAEYQLLDSGRLSGSAPVDLLVAPHHGSKTSSTPRFVHQLRPKQVVFSAGYQHQFGHPHPSVSKRYGEVGSDLWNTAEQGAITFEWLLSGELEITAARRQAQRWWR
jgi:competence protein ComEC